MKVYVPVEAKQIFEKLIDYYLSKYNSLVPEFTVSFFVTRNRLPRYLSYDIRESEFVFYVPISWIPLQFVLANQVISLHILKKDIPPQLDVDGIGIIHRHPSPGNLTDDVDCYFPDGSAIVANVVWSETYPLNSGFISACTKWSVNENENEVVLYKTSDVKCTICEGGRVPIEWVLNATKKSQLSKIVTDKNLSKSYLEKLFDISQLL